MSDDEKPEEITIMVKQEDMIPDASVDDEVDDENGEGNLMIADDEEEVEAEAEAETEDNSGVNDVVLEKLPRPVHDLNCRQSRTYLVKLLRAANGGLNPHYGNPSMRPAFWPDYYWPWTQLSDVHTKPRGMHEPLQYSEMMKLAIARGYQYFGYDPDTYWDANGDQEDAPAPSASATTVGGKNPPKLPRPLATINCVQARTVLSRLLRFQQSGNNPSYGSPETEPPWWPNELIRWTDMVDLRGKPPYLPPTHNYTEVMKQAIDNAYKYYGYDPQLYVDPELLKEPGMSRKHLQKPQHQAAPVVPSTSNQTGVSSKLIYMAPSPRVIQAQPNNTNSSSIIVQTASEPIVLMQSTGNGAKDDDIAAEEEDEESEVQTVADDEEENLPPKLPLPIGKLNCSATRTALAKLIRFHCGNQLPNYGNPASMPSWWPNHLINWGQIKNLSHKYEGYLGNTYSNCLRIAVIRGYAHYGLDANEYVDNQGPPGKRHYPEEIVIEPEIYKEGDNVVLSGTPVTAKRQLCPLCPSLRPSCQRETGRRLWWIHRTRSSIITR